MYCQATYGSVWQRSQTLLYMLRYVPLIDAVAFLYLVEALDGSIVMAERLTIETVIALMVTVIAIIAAMVSVIGWGKLLSKLHDGNVGHIAKKTMASSRFYNFSRESCLGAVTRHSGVHTP